MHATLHISTMPKMKIHTGMLEICCTKLLLCQKLPKCQSAGNSLGSLGGFFRCLKAIEPNNSVFWVWFCCFLHVSSVWTGCALVGLTLTTQSQRKPPHLTKMRNDFWSTRSKLQNYKGQGTQQNCTKLIKFVAHIFAWRSKCYFTISCPFIDISPPFFSIKGSWCCLHLHWNNWYGYSDRESSWQWIDKCIMSAIKTLMLFAWLVQ